MVLLFNNAAAYCVKVQISMTAPAVPLHSLARQLARLQQLLATSPPLTSPPDPISHLPLLC